MEPGTIDKIRSSVCAIGYLDVEHQRIAEDPEVSHFTIIGTGFLVQDTTVVTNRHVITSLRAEVCRYGIPDQQRFVEFVYRNGDGWSTAFKRIASMSVLEQPDIGFVQLPSAPDAEVQPVTFGDLSSITVGSPVASCGFPYGSDLLEREGKFYRFGSVLQRGYISAIAPFDTQPIRLLDELLLDMRIAEGMSGSPVFIPESGEVVGIVYASWEQTTAVAIPLPSDMINQLVQASLNPPKGQEGV